MGCLHKNIKVCHWFWGDIDFCLDCRKVITDIPIPDLEGVECN